MKIALIGYGKMGKAIEEKAIQRGHSIVAKFNSSNPLNVDALKSADVAIEITRPEFAVRHIETCINAKTPVVTGTTGWYEDFKKVEQIVSDENGSLLYATNFSLGVNIFFALNRKLAELLAPYSTDFDTKITEIHHTEKLDAPSGTAISLAEQILPAIPKYEKWELVENEKIANSSVLPIVAERIPNVPGTHLVDYSSQVETFQISHVAKSRDGFALGAVLAAEFLKDKQGIYTMKDVLNV